MPRRERSSSSKGKAPDMDWDATDDPDCVAEEGWKYEEEDPWTCTTCKKYVKMKHLMKLWPRAQARISGPRREGLASNCLSNHFTHRYHEVTIAVGVRNTRPEIMLYSNMSMVWAEIVLHKDIDWRTVAGLNVNLMDRTKHFIPTTWSGPSDCWPRWSNRTSFDNVGGRSRDHTPPRDYGRHGYNDYPTYQNEMTPTPVAFHGSGGGYYDYRNGEYRTLTNIPEEYTPTQPRYSLDSWHNPSKYDEGQNTLNYTPVSFGGHERHTPPRYSIDSHPNSSRYREEYETPNSPSASFGRHVRGISPRHSVDSRRESSRYEEEQHDRNHTPISYGGSERITPRRHSIDSRPRHGRNEEDEHTRNYAPISFGTNRSGTHEAYRKTRAFRSTMEEDAEFEQQMREATLRSQEEYIRKLEDDNRFMERRYNDLYAQFSSGPYSTEAGPSRRHNDSSDED